MLRARAEGIDSVYVQFEMVRLMTGPVNLHARGILLRDMEQDEIMVSTCLPMWDYQICAYLWMRVCPRASAHFCFCVHGFVNRYILMHTRIYDQAGKQVCTRILNTRDITEYTSPQLQTNKNASPLSVSCQANLKCPKCTCHKRGDKRRASTAASHLWYPAGDMTTTLDKWWGSSFRLWLTKYSSVAAAPMLWATAVISTSTRFPALLADKNPFENGAFGAASMMWATEARPTLIPPLLPFQHKGNAPRIEALLLFPWREQQHRFQLAKRDSPDDRSGLNIIPNQHFKGVDLRTNLNNALDSI